MSIVQRHPLVPLLLPVLLAAGCQDYAAPVTPPAPDPGPTPRVVTSPAGGISVGRGSGTPAGDRSVAVTATVRATKTVVERVVTERDTATVVSVTVTVPGVPRVAGAAAEAGTGVMIFDAFLANPIRAEAEYLNRTVRIRGLGTVGKDDRGFFVTFPVTAVAPGEVKPKPGLVAYIRRGDEGAFADLKRDATVSVEAVVRGYKTDQPGAFRGLVIELDNARLLHVDHRGY